MSETAYGDVLGRVIDWSRTEREGIGIVSSCGSTGGAGGSEGSFLHRGVFQHIQNETVG